ncbi:class I SAM-dependent methyltransferase [Synechocystis salina LEGE 06099]|uniref:class I SAM-dependent methyltransferase n=1 Tax=Synechocystis salina TaxID=945780 RepID=UPI0018821B89|nr:class I SAM-dependent methyltransferase [Synechocystis salina]MBE9203875.1 class I SAM-dependent methyltransferase [Synechocystis salina LEGE 06099]
MLRKIIRKFGFDIVKVKNLEEELKRREKEREKRRIQEVAHLREIRLRFEKEKVGDVPYITYVDRDQLKATACKLMKDVDSVLDIGCAFRPQEYIESKVHICCEPYSEYMDRLIVEKSNDSKYVFVNCDLKELDKIFPAGSVDSAILNDVIEHAEKEVGLRALAVLKKIVRQQIIVFTPLGFMSQESEQKGLDQWGMGGAVWQEHLSGWLPADFPEEEGWQIIVCKDYHQVDGYGRPLDKPFGAMYAILSNDFLKLKSL